MTVPNANALKIKNVEIYVVAVGSYISGIDEMVKVASSPPEDYLFRVNDYEGLGKVVNLAIKKVNGKYSVVNYKSLCN